MAGGDASRRGIAGGRRPRRRGAAGARARATRTRPSRRAQRARRWRQTSRACARASPAKTPPATAAGTRAPQPPSRSYRQAAAARVRCACAHMRDKRKVWRSLRVTESPRSPSARARRARSKCTPRKSIHNQRRPPLADCLCSPCSLSSSAAEAPFFFSARRSLKVSSFRRPSPPLHLPPFARRNNVADASHPRPAHSRAAARAGWRCGAGRPGVPDLGVSLFRGAGRARDQV